MKRKIAIIIAMMLILSGCSDNKKKEEKTTETEELATLQITTEPVTDDMELIVSGEDTEQQSTELQIDKRYNAIISGESMITEKYDKILLLESLMEYMKGEMITTDCLSLEFIKKDPEGKGGYLAYATMGDGTIWKVQIYPRDGKWVMIEYIWDRDDLTDGGMGGEPDEVHSATDAAGTTETEGTDTSGE